MPKGCSESLDALYLLPNFFIEAGKSLQTSVSIPIYFAIRFIGPDEEILSPTLASDIRDVYTVTIGNSPTNEYEKALWEIQKAITIREPRRVLVLLTDGTFSSPDYADEERKNVSDALRDIQGLGGEVYTLLCSESNKDFWEDLASKGLLTAAPYRFPEGIVELSKRLFGEVNINNGSVGWFTTTSDLNIQILLPREGGAADIKLLVITDKDQGFQLPGGGFLPLNPIEKRGDFKVYEARSNFPINPSCQSQLISVWRKGGIMAGFYVVQSENLSTRQFDVRIGVSVNNGRATLSFSPTVGLMPPACYTFSLRSEEITAGQGQNFVWEPLFREKPPRDIPTSVHLQVAGDDNIIIECGTISLPVRFAPQPDVERAFARSTSNNRIKEIPFSFQYVVPSHRPDIHLCSSQPPPYRLHETNLVCGTPYPDGSTMVCPTPVYDGIAYCVKAEFADGQPTAAHPIVVKEECDGNKGVYTITFYWCLENCQYKRIVFQWPDSDLTVDQKAIYVNKGGYWQLESSAK
ncbi:MAG: hypothetical protein ACPLYD_10405 [Anaerolineae bacterium]